MLEQLGGNIVPVMAISCTFVFLVIWVIAATIDSIYKTRCNTKIKQRLIERGASAHEIDQVLRAGQEQWGEDTIPAVPPVKSYS